MTRDQGTCMDHVALSPVDGLPSARPRATAALLLLALVLSLPSLLTGLGARDSTHTMENVALVVSQETWLTAHHDDPAYRWYLTYNDGSVRVAKPPLVSWINRVAWAGLDPDTAGPDALLYRARLASVAAGVVLLLAVFWIGCTLQDRRLGLTAALITASIWFFQRQARTASYDIHTAALEALAVACAVWAVECGVRERHAAGRGRLGWIACGVATAGAVLSKNPLAVVVITVPLVALLMARPERLRRAVGGIFLAAGIAALLVGPWYAAVLATLDQAPVKLAHEFRQARDDAQPVYYYLGLLGLVLPWSLWLIAGLFHPFTHPIAGDRRRQRFCWFWFVGTFILFSIPEAKQQRYILPIIPATALLIAWVWHDQHRQQREDGASAADRFLREAHWIAMTIGSMAFGLFLASQERISELLLDGGSTVITPVAPLPAVIVGVVLLGLALVGWRAHARGHLLAAASLTAVWGIVLMTVFWRQYGTADSGVHPQKHEARHLRALVGEAEVRSLRTGDPEDRYMLNEEFRFYFGRLIPPLTIDELGRRADDGNPPEYVLALTRPPFDDVLTALGAEPVADLRTDKRVRSRLWRLPATE